MAYKSTRTGKRQIRRIDQSRNAASCIGDLYPDMELFALTKGDFSIISVIEHCLAQTGPADVVIGTWTAANAEIKIAEEFLSNGGIRSLLFVIDRSFPTRQPAYYRTLIERFGAGIVRMTRSHCKFVLIQNERWNLVIRTSMNLNENRRVESFEISDDPDMAAYLHEVVDELFGNPPEFTEDQFEALSGNSDPFPGLAL